MAKNVNAVKSAGRPAGSRTKLRGLVAFMREHGYNSRPYVHEVLTGKRSGGRPVRLAWARWKAANAAAK